MNTKDTLIRRICFLLLCCPGIWMACPCAGRQNDRISSVLNIYSGLPTNHIYGTTVDHLGYLWLATPKGVVRYNGYESRLYDVANGLPTEDIWYLFEDKAGRMWLSSVSNEIGYIRNDRYYPVFRTDPYKARFYPAMMQQMGDGIAFLNKDKTSGMSDDWSYFEFSRTGKKMLKLDGFRDAFFFHYRLTKEGDILAFCDKGIFKMAKNWAPGASRSGKKISWTKTGNIPDNMLGFFLKNERAKEFIPYKKYICFFIRNTRELWASDIGGSASLRNVAPPMAGDEKIINCYGIENNFYVIGSRNVYILDSVFNLLRTYSMPALTNNEKLLDNNPRSFFDYPLWGIMLGTFDKGLYISHRISGDFIKRETPDMNAFRFAGNLNDSTGYWWNNNTHQMRIVTTQGPGSLRTFPRFLNVEKIMPCGPDRIMVQADGTIFQVSIRNGREYHDYIKPTHYGFIKKSVALHKDSLFLLPSGRNLFSHISGKDKNLDAFNCQGMVFDRPRYGIWLYGYGQLSFYDIRKNTVRKFDTERAGIRKIERVVIDELYGNIWVLDYDRLLLLDEQKDSMIPVLSSFRYNDAFVIARKDRLLIAGRFGVLCAAIKGKGILGSPEVYENVRDIYYNTVYDAQLAGGTLFMRTDQGFYQVAVSGKEGMVASPQDDHFRFIVSTTDTAFVFHANDTICLPFSVAALQLDLIRPSGRGKPEYFYYIPGKTKGWQELYGNTLSLAGLRSGRYQQVWVRASDNIWNGPVWRMNLFIYPRWWQRPLVQGALALLLLCLVAIIILLTRNIVLRKQAQQQLLLEMGMKGVYAQLNPHFIFNSLTTAQHFIRSGEPREAAQHISRFSRLLRNFLRASRQKYSTLSEEKEHLENYLELQRARYREKLSYHIDISPEVDLRLKVPSLLLQPLVENALQHGLFHKEGPGSLSLRFKKEQGALVILIEDDGVGRAAAAAVQQETNRKWVSYGTDLLRDLIYIFKKYEGLKIDLRYTDKALPQTGTLVTIIIHNPHL